MADSSSLIHRALSAVFGSPKRVLRQTTADVTPRPRAAASEKPEVVQKLEQLSAKAGRKTR